MKTNISIQPGEIHLWMTRPQDIQESSLLARYEQLMSPEEQTKQQRYRFEKDRHDALITRAFVRDLLSQYANIAPQDWRFEKGEKDKPEIINAPLPLRFNLSHTKELIICAVCLAHDIGCDVEYIGRENDILAIADRYFSPNEVNELFALPEAEQRSRFFDYWTLKESYIKAWGLGLAIPLDQFSFAIGTPANSQINTDISLSFAPERQDTPSHWHSWLLYLNQQHRIAISIRNTIQHPANGYTLRYFQSIPLISNHEIDFLD